MSKIIKTAALVAGITALTVLSGGTLPGFIGALSGSIGAALGVGTLAAGAIAGAVLGAGLTVVSSVLTPSIGDVAAQAGQKVPITNAVDTRKLVYGRARIGGAEIFIDEYDSNAGDDTPNDTLVFARVVCDRPIEGFED
ncbi:MAG: hypothetical protein JKY34_09045, partial [Kordiimonadaceae bacterium]|nr:hypothetical protein [Kordiimonadaceae bacterium]